MEIRASGKIKNHPACFKTSAEAQNHLPHEKCSVSMIVIKSISRKYKIAQNTIQTNHAQVFRITAAGCVFITNENIRENPVYAFA